MVALCTIALLAPLLAPYPPEVQDLTLRYRPPSVEHLMVAGEALPDAFRLFDRVAGK